MFEQADKFVARASLVGGGLIEVLGGLMLAPDLQRRMRHFGVNPFALEPVIMAVAAAVGAFLGWRVGRQSRLLRSPRAKHPPRNADPM